jgi:hypothetical protein
MDIEDSESLSGLQLRTLIVAPNYALDDAVVNTFRITGFKSVARKRGKPKGYRHGLISLDYFDLHEGSEHVFSASFSNWVILARRTASWIPSHQVSVEMVERIVTELMKGRVERGQLVIVSDGDVLLLEAPSRDVLQASLKELVSAWNDDRRFAAAVATETFT